MLSYQASSCQPNPICRDLNITFKPTDYNNQNIFAPILAYGGQGSANGGPIFTLDAGNLGQGPEGILLQMTIGTQAKISTTDYFLYGSVQATLRHNARQGLVAAFILMSDIKDEVDWEFTTANGSTGYTNYFNQGQYVSGHGTTVLMPNSGGVSDWHTFGLNWTPNRLQWTIDGNVVRTLTQAQAGVQYPRSPARVQFSTWAGGNATGSEPGTQEWAGGLIDWTTSEYQNNGYYAQEMKSYSISCADPTDSGSSSGSRRDSGNYTSWVYTGQQSSSTGEPAFQLSTSPISAIKNPGADGAPLAPGASGLASTSIKNSWNGSGAKVKTSTGKGSGSSGSSSGTKTALKYGVPIAAGIVGLVLLWGIITWLSRKRRMSSVGKNNPLGAPGTAIVGNAFSGSGKQSKYAPLHDNAFSADMDDAPMGAQRVGTGIGPAVGPRPGPMSGTPGRAPAGGPPGYGRGGRNVYEMAAQHTGAGGSAPGSPFGYPNHYASSPYGQPVGRAPGAPNQSGYFPGPRAAGGAYYGGPSPAPQNPYGGGGYSTPYAQPAYRDY
ncbi:putative glycosidase CRH2 [Tilletia horrida]|uniref:Glycosidase CRH2 n=1 Tax=Tilletia horrida TaxID=155126 RepID=A0AAN6JPG4_9BASI|nr:putative glycosidase CRH2 [Tilletia horrida]KAK0544821.1 putative glycosidase CRH2 [Tilletia horrida]